MSGSQAAALDAQSIIDELVPKLGFPSELPIVDRRAEIVEAINKHQVLIVAGETGSGKSTQLPKLCVEAGRGVAGLIGHTQPRRLAARSIAERIAEETETSVGETIGFAFRFNDRVGPRTRIKLMTDGILLAEIQRDRELRKYDTLIIDEAHERSLNIDFILGYLRQLLPRRPDLKVIVTSATIDTERFSQHFQDAPIIEVSGRTYPVEVRYQPIDGPGVDEPLGQPEGICQAATRLMGEGPGDMLVFLAGERDIRETAEALTDLSLPDTEIFPLYARLSSGEQHRVFQAHSGRRIVLATNVAETSVTVPGIRYVIDPGNARISRYSHRTKVQRLPIEAISQASADQRAGRCGRVGPGICVRLYAEDDYNAREEFTEPEIRRTNLASVILQMASLGLGDISSFPFVEPPDQRSITDGIQLLEELDALDPEYHGTKQWLTPMGRELAKLPVDPRFGRMIIEAADQGALREVMIIVAGMSVQDPRERPSDQQQKADESHGRFAHESSDFLTLLSLWGYLQTERKNRSNGQFRRMCKREFLNYNRIREWQDIHNQLKQTTRDLGYRQSGNEAKPETIHRSLLAGLLSHIGMKDTKRERDNKRTDDRQGRDKRNRRPEFIGARNARFVIAAGSALTKQPPAWVMAAELVETNRMWARMAAPIDPTWAEALGSYLVKRTYTDPTWDPAQGVAHTRERVTLYGLPLVGNRQITVGSVNPELGRELFIHHALVEGEWEIEHRFLEHNEMVKAEVAELEARSRRRDLLVEQQARYEFFDERIPEHVSSGRHFNKWWKKVKVPQPDLLKFTVEDLTSDVGETIDTNQFPDVWHYGDLELELAYEFDTGSHVDGVSVHVPVEVLNQLSPEPFEWSVPGFRSELISSLVRSLPKGTRKALMPIGDTVAEITPQLHPDEATPELGLHEALRRTLGRQAGVELPADGFVIERVSKHLRPTFRVINDRLEVLAEGKDLGALKQIMAQQVKESLSQVAASSTSLERTGLRTWDFDDLPRQIETPGPTHTIRAFPSLVDESDSVAIRLHASEEDQAEAMWLGTRRLVRFQLPSPVRRLDAMFNNRTKLQLATDVGQTKAEWYNDCINCAIDEAIAVHGGPSWNAAGFEELVVLATKTVPEALTTLAGATATMVETLSSIQRKLEPVTGSNLDISVRDIRAHVGRLTYPGFLAGVGFDRIGDVARFLEAIDYRVDHLADNPARDLQTAAECVNVEQRHSRLVNELGPSSAFEEVTWLLEELRVSRFAQHLRGPEKVSVRRVERRLNELDHQDLV